MNNGLADMFKIIQLLRSWHWNIIHKHLALERIAVFFLCQRVQIISSDWCLGDWYCQLQNKQHRGVLSGKPPSVKTFKNFSFLAKLFSWHFIFHDYYLAVIALAYTFFSSSWNINAKDILFQQPTCQVSLFCQSSFLKWDLLVRKMWDMSDEVEAQ